MQAAKEFCEQLELQRAQLTPNQLKKQRKKRARLLQQAAMAGDAGAGQPAVNRLQHDDEPEVSASMQLPANDHNQDRDAADSQACSNKRRRTQQKQLIQKPFLAAPLKRLQKRTPGANPSQTGHSSDMSDLVKALGQHSHQAACSDQPHQAEETDSMQWVSAAPVLMRHGDSEAAGLTQEAVATATATAADSAAAVATEAELAGTVAAEAVAAAGAAPQDGAHMLGGMSQHKSGPCRSDLSGQLMLINQQLSSNNSSSSYLPALQLQPAACNSTGSHQPAAPGQQQQQGQVSRKQQRPPCRYGNYHHYYGYRLGPAGFEDPRLKVLDPSWFKGVDVLDVGCNEGLLTLALAVGCGCRSTTGVDIDAVLVSKACKNLSRSRTQLTQQFRAALAARDAHERSMTPLPPAGAAAATTGTQAAAPAAAAAGVPCSSAQSQAGNSASSSSMTPLTIIKASSAAVGCSAPGIHSSSSSGGSGGASNAASMLAGSATMQQPQQQQQQPLQLQTSAHQAWDKQQRSLQAQVVKLDRQLKALSRVSFKAGDWLQLGCASNKYEAITCFSVTKWIHLNWGDDGIMKLFHKFYRCLAPGGVLVLEPQPYKSYKNATHKPGVQEAPFHKLDQLKLRPEGFCDFLTQRVGFELLQQLSAVSEVTGVNAVARGFDRPILVFKKPVVGLQKTPSS